MSINIKKYTKEQMAGMVEAAQAANAELERQVATLGDQIYKQSETNRAYAKKAETLKADNDFLRKKLTDTETTLGRVDADLATLTFALHRKHERIKELADKLANCKADLKWAQEHPWKHLWECLKGARND